MIELRRLEASMQVAENLSNNSHITFIPIGAGSGNLLNLRVWIYFIKFKIKFLY